MGNPTATCAHCARTMPNNAIARHERTHDAERADALRLARNERQREYSRSPEGRATELRRRRSDKGRAGHLRRIARWRATESGRAARNAHAAVQRAVLSGRLLREPCAVCGDPKSQGHHANGYDDAHRLDVVWLCEHHHKEAHRAAA